MRVKTALLLTCAVMATTMSARAEDAVLSTAPPAVAAVAPPVAAADTIDLSALYYFASRNDFGRVEAEIKLIRIKNPNWQPPEDLYTASGGSDDEQPLWDLFAKHDLAGLHAQMDAMRQGRPGWQPSNTLSSKLALAEAHDALVAASEAKQWPAVVAVASANKMLLTCNDLDALWRTAEALARSGDEARAVGAYGYVIESCDRGQRMPTAQKASLVLQSAGALDQVIRMGQPQPDGSGEFDRLRLDRYRQKIGEAASGTSDVQPTQAEIDAVTANAMGPTGQADTQLLGWYAYARRNYPEAQRWFRVGLADPATQQKSAEGLVLALRDASDWDEAREVAVRYAGLDNLNRRLMVDTLSASLTDPKAKPMTAEQMTALSTAVDAFKSQDGAESLRWYCDNKNDAAGAKAWTKKAVAWKGEEITEHKSAEGAEALGWQLLQSDDAAGAEAWFQKSVEWKPNESAVVGLLLTARRLRHDRDYTARLAQYRTAFPGIAKFETAMRPKKGRPVKVAAPKGSGGNAQWDQSADEIVKTFKAGNYETAVALLEKRRTKYAEPRGLSVIRGWAMYQKGDWNGAKQVFTGLDGGKYSNEREVGLRVIDESFTNPRYR